MLFEKKIEPRCVYCKRGVNLDEDRVLCIKRGIMSPAGSCRRFKYEPLKRTPPKPVSAKFSHLSEDDFKL